MQERVSWLTTGTIVLHLVCHTEGIDSWRLDPRHLIWEMMVHKRCYSLQLAKALRRGHAGWVQAHGHWRHELVSTRVHHGRHPSSHPHDLNPSQHCQSSTVLDWGEIRNSGCDFEFWTWTCSCRDFKYSIASSRMDALSLCNYFLARINHPHQTSNVTMIQEHKY